MAPEPQFESVIVGLGRTGVSCLRYLTAAESGPFAVVDSRAEPPGLPVARAEFPGVPVFTGGFHETVLLSARRLLVSPGVSLDQPALRKAAAAGVEITGDVELFARVARRPIVAVTASNGKSTAATLVHEMIREAGLKSALGGNIGTPALDLLAAEPPDFYVLELSSFQLETVSSMNAAAAAVLNVSADHMDRYRSVGEYALAKERIYRGGGVMVINLDDAAVRGMRRPGRTTLGFTLGRPGPAEFGLRTPGGSARLALGERTVMKAGELLIYGRHNVANALAACALAHAVEIPFDAMRRAMRRFRGLPHRCQWVAERGGVNWYNDSKGTNVGAACAAMAGIETGAKLVLIAGGDGKGADFSPLAEAAGGRLRAAVLIGRDARRIGAVLEPIAPVCYATSLEAAVEAAAGLAAPGDTVLLSPACASFDMFENFERRGEAFVAAVKRLVSQGAPK